MEKMAFSSLELNPEQVASKQLGIVSLESFIILSRPVGFDLCQVKLPVEQILLD